MGLEIQFCEVKKPNNTLSHCVWIFQAMLRAWNGNGIGCNGWVMVVVVANSRNVKERESKSSESHFIPMTNTRISSHYTCSIILVMFSFCMECRLTHHHHHHLTGWDCSALFCFENNFFSFILSECVRACVRACIFLVFDSLFFAASKMVSSDSFIGDFPLAN